MSGHEERADRTVMVRTPDFDASGAAWRPFKFRGLEPLTRTQIVLSQRVYGLLNGAAGPGAFPPQTLQRLQDLFEEEVRLSLEEVRVLTPLELGRVVSGSAVFALLAPASKGTKGGLELDLPLAHAVVDLLLGGTGTAVAARPLTEIEEGVLGFVLAEALRAMAPVVDPSLQRLRLEGLLRRPEDIFSVLSNERHVAVVVLRARVGKYGGLLKLYLPESVLARVEAPPPGPPTAKRLESRGISQARATLHVNVGKMELSRNDLSGLRPGDVVLVDEMGFRPDKGQPGPVRMVVGAGQHGHALGAAALVNGRYQVTFQKFLVGGEGHTVDAKNEAGTLLGDVPLQVSVELARLPLNAEQVLSLKVGQVIDLNRVPDEPVSLAVNGKVVGRGELVEVEGHLGVRILNLAE